MRQESNMICRAFLARLPKRAARTYTDGERLYLHGNQIAWWGQDEHLYLTLYGYGTPTTRDRLNTMLRILEIDGGFHQHKHEQYFGTRMIDAHDILRIRMHNGKRVYSSADAIMLDNELLPTLLSAPTTVQSRRPVLDTI